jgi:ubiquitin C-terminal hydrolase
VKFSLYLDMDDFIVHRVAARNKDLVRKYKEADESSWTQPKYLYRLYGVVDHAGSMGGGHYISYTCYEEAGERHWYMISDSMFRKTTEKRALEAEGYILFYKRVDSSEFPA